MCWLSPNFCQLCTCGVLDADGKEDSGESLKNSLLVTSIVVLAGNLVWSPSEKSPALEISGGERSQRGTALLISTCRCKMS